ncbi:S9 family peptidase [Bowmanella denitrificans]|uniref:S9 family peptidase n=1 Tax=Bowmanella denitrificans TaxID=366582 RepID=UPI000C9A8ABC|nr:prolyl oligopeptidase family serine peptidase [Bowmanella denitrificans]
MKTTMLALLAALSTPLLAGPLNSEAIQALGPVKLGQLHDGPHQEAILHNLQSQVSQTQSSKITLLDKSYSWQRLSEFRMAADSLGLFRTTLSVDRYTQGELLVEGFEKLHLYVNGHKLSKGDKGFKLALTTGEHQLFVIAQDNKAEQSPKFEFIGKTDEDQLILTDKGKQRLSASQLFDTEVVSGLTIADNGQYALISYKSFNGDKGDSPETRTELLNLKNMQVMQSWDSSPSGAVFSPDSQHLLYSKDDKLQLLDLKSLKVSTLTAELKDASGFTFMGKDKVLFSWNKPGKDDGKLVKHYQALEDRWSGWRDNSQLYLLDLPSGLIRQLTKASASSYLLDSDEKRGTLLLSRAVLDYSEPPHGKTALFELDLASGTERQIGEYLAFNSASYGKDGIYVIGGPSFAGGTGVNVSAGLTPNDYDGQLYFMDLQGQQVKALSKDFDPAISSIQVLDNDDLLLSVSKADRTPLYWYDASKGQYQELSSQLDVVKHWAATSDSKAQILYAGTGASSPQALYSQKLGRKADKIWDSAGEYADTLIPSLEEFNFVNADGVTIEGRVYLPNDLNKDKKYPALVYYYGGTAPVSRAFTGRYPFNLWAANGYVVYVLQPTGTYGFGQDFSARHVNAWGDYTAKDIIDGTKAFLAAHPYVDADKVGHLGASYGGFMTMYLATQTDIFAASISHAGISNLTSYWGQGWWGAMYSGVASRGSFPWNNAGLYSQHSPVFHADKVTNPILLIHGDADTNVPPGESQNMYTALKLLGKEVDLVEYKGDNHHILTREKTFHWWATMLAYFDKHLKGQPQWWESLYPSQYE